MADGTGVYRMVASGGQTEREVIEASRYANCDGLVLGACGLWRRKRSEAIIEVFGADHFGRNPTDEEMLAEYRRRSLQRPTMQHVVRFGRRFPDLPVKGHPIIFYIEPMIKDPVGSQRVVCLWRGPLASDDKDPVRANERHLYAFALGATYDRSTCLFAGVR